MSKINGLLTEILRPKKLEDIILLDRVRAQVGDNSLSQNFLLVGSPGTGKSSLCRILTGERASLNLNLSSERGIEVVRTQIQNFCATKSLNLADQNDDCKVVFMDEMDYASPGLYAALRATMEKFQESTRFIGTCNYLEKIPEPIQSRFLILDYNPKTQKEEEELIGKYMERLQFILKKLKINYADDSILTAFIDEFFPDFRSIVKQIQAIHQSGQNEITIENIQMIDHRLEELFNITLNEPDPKGNYQLLINATSGKHNDVFAIFSSRYSQWLLDRAQTKADKLPNVIACIADWNYKSNFVIDPQLCVLAMIYQLQMICNQK